MVPCNNKTCEVDCLFGHDGGKVYRVNDCGSAFILLIKGEVTRIEKYLTENRVINTIKTTPVK
ncbi:MAG: DUF4884 domain-containing protein [Prolixibacteraceae bacterium]|nr:DUF4884 domain-containing protein [Prolixibacteraceae bacterium]